MRIFLIVLFAATPFLGRSEESGIKVRTNGGSFEIKTGSPDQVVVERTVVQPKAGCGCSLDSGGPCK